MTSFVLYGLTPHNVELKVGDPITLFRKLDPPKMCNRTTLVVKKMMSQLTEAIILSGCDKWEYVFIPRIPLAPTVVKIISRDCGL